MSMTSLITFSLKSFRSTEIGYDFDVLFEGLASRGAADVAIVSSEDGFSPLGASRSFFEHDLGISYEMEIQKLANFNSSEEKVTLCAIPSRRQGSFLKGIILAPGSNSKCYEKFVRSAYSKPSRDFYYNVSYEAISHACKEWGAKKLAISHLCGANKFHPDMVSCHLEALSHFCKEAPEDMPESFIFCGCCMNKEHFGGVNELLNESSKTRHRLIEVTTEDLPGHVLITLNLLPS